MGHELSELIIGLVSYKMTEDLSVINCYKWMNNNPYLLKELRLEPFGKDALYRGFEKIDEHRHQSLRYLLFTLKKEYDVGFDMVFMDWTSIHFEAQSASLIQYGYSRDYRPDRPQVTIGLAQDERSQLPVGLSIQPENINDQTYFNHTYDQIKPGLRTGSCLVFDAGATGGINLDLLVLNSMLRYLSQIKLNTNEMSNDI